MYFDNKYDDESLYFVTEDTVTTFGNEFNIKSGKSIPCKIDVYPNEGDRIPHFHFKFEKHGRIYDGCIQICASKYFIHGNHKDTLTSKESLLLDKWLGLNHRGTDKTNWQFIVELWNKSKDNQYKVYLKKQPDYSTIIM